MPARTTAARRRSRGESLSANRMLSRRPSESFGGNAPEAFLDAQSIEDAPPCFWPEEIADELHNERIQSPVWDGESDFDPGFEGQSDRGRRYADLSSAEQETLRRDLQHQISAFMSSGKARVIVTDNLHTMVSVKRGRGLHKGVFTFRIHHMFLNAPPRILRAVSRYAEKQDSESAKVVRAYVDANEDRIRRRDEAARYNLDTQGKNFDLRAIFDDLNERYFDGTIAARITWGSRHKRRRTRDSIRLGSYTVEDALIRIHPVLDASDIPRFYLEWIIYHEMLHEIHEMPIVGGRRIYHTREFREAEANFEHHSRAIAWESANMHRLLER